jgi:MacB-like periplasmic core domain
MRNVGLAMYSPLDGNQWTDGVFLPGKPLPGLKDDNNALLDRINPNFFAAVGRKVVRGRSLKESDNEQAPSVAVVNEAFAKKFFPNVDPIGRRFGIYESGLGIGPRDSSRHNRLWPYSQRSVTIGSMGKSPPCRNQARECSHENE